jgi:ADP-ribosyl-[dinitrogen reductase] hydrolase
LPLCCGASEGPAASRRISHGYPCLRTECLVELAHLANQGFSVYDWPVTKDTDYVSRYALAGTLVRDPHDDGVWLSEATALEDLPGEVTAVVGLCLVGRKQICPGNGLRLFRQGPG